MTFKNVIVFGPTGAVGSTAAQTAATLGANVTLAMRDLSKPIAGLTGDGKQGSGYKRVYADLCDPDSVRVAVTQAAATHAFVYTVFNDSTDHMRASAEALKAAGIKFVCLLSSASIQGDLHSVPPSDSIAFGHAQVEISFQEVFGPRGYVAVRPSFFASNSLWWRSQILEGDEVKFPFPGVKFDYISPEDIGAVCATILVKGLETAPAIPLAGPEELSVSDAIDIICKAIGKKVKVTKSDREESIHVFVAKSGVPEGIANVLINQFEYLNDNPDYMKDPQVKEAKENIEKYLKRPPTRFSTWVEQNKEKFAAV